MSSSELQTLQSAFKSGSGHWVDLHHLAKDRFTLAAPIYQRQYEPNPLRLAGVALKTPLVRRSRPGRCLRTIQRPFKKMDLHPNHEAGCHCRSGRSGKLEPKRRSLFRPFGQWATTLIAAEKTGRHASLIELDPK